MCQLLGMNCAAPTDFSFSLRGFCKRGGETDIHSHGWGVSVYEGRSGAIGLRSFHDTLPACQSPIANFIQQYPMRTHVRIMRCLPCVSSVYQRNDVSSRVYHSLSSYWRTSITEYDGTYTVRNTRRSST